MHAGRNFSRRGFLQTSVASGAAAWMLTGGSRGREGTLRADTGAEAAGLSTDRFRELHDQLAPDDGEALQAIPWKIQINEARKLAAERKQPLFMLSRSGHPLGCT